MGLKHQKHILVWENKMLIELMKGIGIFYYCHGLCCPLYKILNIEGE